MIALAQQADREAQEELFARIYPDLLQAARFRLGPVLRARMDTLDLAQTAYLEALRDLRRYRYQGKGSFKRWLLAILENKIRRRLQFFKARRRDLRREVPLEPGHEIPSRSPSITGNLIAREDRERLEGAMDKLPEDYREVIVNRYYLGLNWAAVGEHMGRSEEAAQMLCKRALARLRKLYGDLG
ncbi:MAG: sigma-70 family RNA polymerase sigma factor [Planctomycetes bacterium]|nr:sigma-70 family RNA polymerase sigma factor [Planctomycetota bacterium]